MNVSIAVGLAVGERRRAFDPVGEGDRCRRASPAARPRRSAAACRPRSTRRLRPRRNRRWPRAGRVWQASASVKVIRSASPSAWQRRRPCSTTVSVASTPCIRATLRKRTRNRIPAPLQQQRSTPVMPAPMPAFSARSIDELEAADVDLLAHDQFPQLALRPAVDRLNVAKTDARRFASSRAPGRKEVYPQPVFIPTCRRPVLLASLISRKRVE